MSTIINGSSPSITFSDNSTQTTAFTTTPTINTITSAASTALTLQSAGTTAVTVDTSQNVGIGTTSPTTRLDVRSSQPTINAQATTNGNAGLLQLTALSSDGSNTCAVQVIGASINNNSASNMIFKNDGGSGLTERMRITSDGYLFINTTSALSGGAARVALKFDGGATWGMGIQTTYSGGTGSRYMQFLNSAGSETGNINQNGTTTVAYTTSSDYRLKEDIAPMSGALATVSALKPCTYKWKSDGSAGQGFIAHELQEVVPDCVTGEKDAVQTYTDEDGNEQTRIKPQGVDTSFLVATLTAAIQELNAKVDAQATTIAELQAKVG